MRRGSAILLALALLLSLAAPAGAEGVDEFEEPTSVEETPVESEPVEETSGEEPPPEEEPEEPVEEPEEAPPIESDEIVEEPPAGDAEPPAGEPSDEPEEAPPIESDEILEEPPAGDVAPPAGEPSGEPEEAPPVESGEVPEAPGDTGESPEEPGTGEMPPTEAEEPPAVTPEDPAGTSPETPGTPADAPVVTPEDPAAGDKENGAVPSPAPESAPLPEEDLVILSQAGLAMAAASAAPAVADVALDTDAVVNVTLDAEAYPILINPYTIAVTDYGETDRSSIVSIPNLIRNDGNKPIRFSAVVTAHPGADLVLAETSTRVSPPADDTQSAFLYLELANLDDPANIGNLIWTEPEDFTDEYDRANMNAVLIQDSSTVDTTVAPGVDIYTEPVPNTAVLTGIPANGYAAYRIGGDSSHPRYYGEWMSGDYNIALSIFFDFSIPQEDMRYKVSFTVKDFLYEDQPPGYDSIADQSIIIAGDYTKSGEYYLCPVTDTISFKLNMAPFEVYIVQYEAYQMGDDGVTKELIGKGDLYTPNDDKPLTPERELMIPEYDFNERTLVEITVLILDPEGRPDLDV